ncbi:phosphohistidine phosphatase [uncultured Gammaproteobacteria bacterium]
MKTLYLLRHGKAVSESLGVDDHERPLEPRGQAAALVVGNQLRERGERLNLILCSTARRVQETLAQVLVGLNAAEAIPEIKHEPGLYLCGHRALLGRLRLLPEAAEAVLVIGHNPELHELTISLVRNGRLEGLRKLRDKFPPASCAILDCNIGGWAGLGPGVARLMALILPQE